MKPTFDQTHGCFISMYDKIHYNKNNNNNFKKSIESTTSQYRKTY